MWGDKQVLHVEHLTPVRAFYVGEPDAASKLEVDFLMGSEVLGSSRMPVVTSTGAAVIPERRDRKRHGRRPDA